MPAPQRVLKVVPPSHTEVDDLLTPEEVAALLKISVDAVRMKARRGHLPAIRIDGRNMRFRRADFEAWLKTRPSIAESWG